MPRPRSRPRLWLRPARYRGSKLIAKATWIILDGGKHIATGCAQGEVDRAERALSEYIAAKYAPARQDRELSRIDIADVLNIYVDDKTPTDADQRKKFVGRVNRLTEFWGGKMLIEVTGASCKSYAALRGRGGARRDLEDLRAAINHHASLGYHRGIVAVTLPEKGDPRDRWLTRSEAAKILWVCWRYREQQRRHRGEDKGKRLPTDKRPLRHLARFILMGLYTGTRAGAIATASPERCKGRSFVDLERGVFYRLAQGRRVTNKRQPPAPIPPRLLAHMRRWKEKGIAVNFFVEWNGRPIKSVKTAFASAVEKAKLAEPATPHTLRHTAATWLMQAGVDLWQAAGFLGMSAATLERVYGHHHPSHLADAAHAIGYGRKPVSLVIPLVTRAQTGSDAAQAIDFIGGPGRTRTSNQTVMSARDRRKAHKKS